MLFRAQTQVLDVASEADALGKHLSPENTEALLNNAIALQ